MTKEQKKRIDALNMEYRAKFGQFFPFVGWEPGQWEEQIKQCLRLGKSQDELDRLSGLTRKEDR